MMTATKQPTKAQATKVLNALKAQRKAYIDGPDSGPKLVKDWDWLSNGTSFRWSIVWEEGPYDWAYLFPHGGIEEEFGFNVPSVADRVTAALEGGYPEAITSWAVGLAPAW